MANEREMMLSGMKIEPTNPLELMNPLYKFDSMIGRAAMEFAGPGKFKSALKLIPLTIDKGRNLSALMKFDDQLMKLNLDLGHDHIFIHDHKPEFKHQPIDK